MLDKKVWGKKCWDRHYADTEACAKISAEPVKERVCADDKPLMNANRR